LLLQRVCFKANCFYSMA
jgi:hypothetical protein